MRILLPRIVRLAGPDPGAAAGRAAIDVVGLDPARAADRRRRSVADRGRSSALPSPRRIGAVVHAAALHKPDIARHPAGRFVAVNVQAR